LFPTILDAVGIRWNKPIEGRSLLPVLSGVPDTSVGDRYLVGQHRGTEITSIRNRRWKLYKNNTDTAKYLELYDLLTDPWEQKNILGKHLDIARHLNDELSAILSASPKYASVSGEFPGWIDSEKRQELIDEGYF